MSENTQKTETVSAEQKKTWTFFTGLTKWASLGTLWVVGMLVAVFGLKLSVLPPLIVLSLLVAAVAYLL